MSANDLRFPQPQVAVLNPLQFNARLYGILAQPAPVRETALRRLAQVSNSVLAGDSGTASATAQLDAAGITVP